MSGGGTTKPIVFVFGAQKGDADGRKRNLSAINTQVAYRAHERRREKKSKQRAQIKEHGKVGYPPAVEQPLSADPGAKVGEKAKLHDFVLQTVSSRKPGQTLTHSSSARPSLTGAFPSHVVPLLIEESRRSQNRQGESDLSSDASSVQDAVWSVSPGSHRHLSPATESTTLSPLAPVQINNYFEKGLDPFFKLPTAATDREKWLVHFYFREMGHIGFGTHSSALFCPDRDWVSTYVSSKSLCFQWVLILAEEQLGRMGVIPDQSSTIERKAKAYGALNLILRAQTVHRDQGISGIMFAAIIDTARTSMHLMALDRLINDTGGFEAFLDGPLGIVHPEHIATVYTFGQCPISTVEDLEAMKMEFLDIIRVLHTQSKQEQDEKRRIRNRRPWDPLSRQIVDGNGVLVPADQDEHFRYYMKSQEDCLTSDCLGPLLNSVLNSQGDYASQARYFAALVQISLILFEFENNYLARAMYLKRLRYVAEMSTARDVETGAARLSHAGLLLINSFVRQEVQDYFDRTKTLLKGVKISKAMVNVLKIFPLLRPSTRSLVVSWLRGWLYFNDDFENVEFVQLQEQDLTNISVEISDAWVPGIGRGP